MESLSGSVWVASESQAPLCYFYTWCFSTCCCELRLTLQSSHQPAGSLPFRSPGGDVYQPRILSCIVQVLLFSKPTVSYAEILNTEGTFLKLSNNTKYKCCIVRFAALPVFSCWITYCIHDPPHSWPKAWLANWSVITNSCSTVNLVQNPQKCIFQFQGRSQSFKR